jgi:hypothetical protein
MFEAIFVFVVEVFGELILQLVGEVLIELGLRSVGAPFRRQVSPWLASLGYAVLGAAVGGLSLWVFAQHFTPLGIWRILNLVVTPILVGLGMGLIGAWRRDRGEELIRIDRFFYGYLFALALALVRFYFAR